VHYVTENPGPIEIEPQEESQRKTDFILWRFLAPNLKSIIYPGGLTQHYSYNNYGQLTSEDNETWNNWDNYTYDRRGNLDTVLYSDGINARYQVTDYDEVWHETITSTFKESLSPLSYVGNYTYYKNGNLWTSSTQSGELSRSNTYTYDYRYNMITDTDSIRGLTTYTYDNNDNITSVSGPSGNIGFSYTDRDLVETVTIGNDTHSFSYDGNGNVSTFTDPFNHVTTYTYDGYDRLRSVKDALSNQTVFSTL